MTEFEFEPTGDLQLDSLLQETQTMIQENNDFLLPDEMVHNAVSRACDFFGLPEAPILENTAVGVLPHDIGTVKDDVFAFNREQLMNMGISGEDSLTLVYTHECAHRALQNYEDLSGKEIELACDFFAGVHAGMGGMDAELLVDALGETSESESHPDGELRAEIIEYGQSYAQSMMSQGMPVTFEGCMTVIHDFLSEHSDFMGLADSQDFGHGENISFGAAYSADEYEAKAENCYKEAEYYKDKAARCDNPDHAKHNLEEAKKWQQRGDEYMRKAYYERKYNENKK